MDNGISYTPAEIEQDRQEELIRLREQLEQTQEEIEATYMNEIGMHEALHAAYMMTEMVSRFLLEHPVCVIDQTAYIHASHAHTALFNLYQTLGLMQHDYITKREEAIDRAFMKL